MIHFTHVTKSYEANWKALNNVTFRINKGEFVFLTGHSGAGKSTVLKLIYMDERPDEQRGGQVMVKFSDNVLYDSKNTPDDRIQALRRKMGIIFQDFKLLPDRNVFENVALALRIVGTPSNKINAAVFDALHNPYLLLADEPTGNLDPKNAEEVFCIFKEINARGTTILMATHNPDFYLNSPFRRLELSHGELLNRDIL